MQTNPKIERALLEVMRRVREPRDEAAICWHMPRHPPQEVSYTLSQLVLRGVLEVTYRPGEPVKYRLANPVIVTQAPAGLDVRMIVRLTIMYVLGFAVLAGAILIARAWMGVPS
jgi:hypothetical protein